MLHCSARSRIALGASVTALLVVAAVVRPHYAVAQEPTPTPVAQTQHVIVSDEQFPWWEVVAAFAAVGLAAAAVYAAGGSFRQYLGQRRRELEQRRREADLDVAKLQGDLVLLLRQQYEGARGSLDEAVRRDELEMAEHVYEAILRGIILTRPEAMKALRELLNESLKVGTSELDSLRARGE